MARSPKCPPTCDGCEVVRTCLDAGVPIPEKVRMDTAMFMANCGPGQVSYVEHSRQAGKTATQVNQEMADLYPGGPSPRERYRTDTSFKALVDMMEAYIHQCKFTPSELREAAVLAAIRYESRRVPEIRITIPKGDGVVECPNCAGEGVTSMGVCSICNGEGKGLPEDFPEVEP